MSKVLQFSDKRAAQIDALEGRVLALEEYAHQLEERLALAARGLSFAGLGLLNPAEENADEDSPECPACDGSGEGTPEESRAPGLS